MIRTLYPRAQSANGSATKVSSSLAIALWTLPWVADSSCNPRKAMSSDAPSSAPNPAPEGMSERVDGHCATDAPFGPVNAGFVSDAASWFSACARACLRVNPGKYPPHMLLTRIKLTISAFSATPCARRFSI